MSPERMPNVGTRLREAREGRGLSLRQIATSTKIPIGVLESIERNDVARLPAGIFSRGFVRSYAGEVGLDQDAAVQDFVAQFPRERVSAGRTSPHAIDDGDTIENDRRTASTFLKIVAISV